ncbi:MAG: tRNA lysidine(34) synthetase TilS [Armatimonadetes bacterium]|nr:tRNA lysidine(34) synthetase TilS [Armatimonadota bacterium]
MWEPLPEVVKAACARYGLIGPGTNALVAVSGGQDSCALLHCLVALRSEWGLALHAAHVNHALRGPEADQDERFVIELCDRLDVPAAVLRADVRGVARRLHLSIQEAARRERLRMLEETRADRGCDVIALAHTSDDRAETVLLNILRGCGLNGLAPMRPRSGANVRPLCEATRAMTAVYCRDNGIRARFDASNRDLHYRRNRVRTELLPELEAYYNPTVRPALLRLSRLAELDSDLLDALARREFETHSTQARGGGLCVRAEALNAIHAALRNRVVRIMVLEASGSDSDLDMDAVVQVVDAVRAGSTLCRTFPCGAVAHVCGDLTVARHAAPRSSRAFCYELTTSKPVWVPEADLEIELANDVAGRLPDRVEPDVVAIPVSAVVGALSVRAPIPGDTVRPMGLGGEKKVMDHLRDAGVGTDARRRFALIADAAGILWLPGVALDERARVSGVPCEVYRFTVRRRSARNGSP